MQFIDLLIYLLLIAFAIVYDFYVVLVLLLLIPLPLLSNFKPLLKNSRSISLEITLCSKPTRFPNNLYYDCSKEWFCGKFFQNEWKCFHIKISIILFTGISSISKTPDTFLWTEAATGGVLWKRVFLIISQKSQKNTCARDYFLIKMQASALHFIKKNFVKFSITFYLTEYLRTIASIWISFKRSVITTFNMKSKIIENITL